MKKLTSILLLVLMSAMAACSSPHRESDSDSTLVGYRLIDANKADEAIDHFQTLLDQNPENDEYRRGLSSAYALRGGFKIQILLEPLRAIQDAEGLKQTFDRLSETLIRQHPTQSSLVGLKNSLKMEIQIIVLMKKFMAIPTPNAAQVEDLKVASSLLSSLKSPTQGDFLYMAVMQTLVLKAVLMEPVKIDSCDKLVWEVQQRGGNALSLYGKILYLMTKAKPSERPNYQEQLRQVAQSSLEISALTSSSLVGLSFLDHAVDQPQMRLLLSSPRCF